MTTQTTTCSADSGMPFRSLRGMTLFSLTCGVLLTVVPAVQAEPPYPIAAFASVDDLAQEVKIQVTRLEKHLATSESFEKQKEKEIVQSFGLLACLGQGLTEHADHAKSPWNGPALRDAALEFTDESDYDAAKSALANVKSVIDGKVTGDHEQEHAWNELIALYPAMEEMNTRNSEIVKILKRPRGKPEEISPVVAWGLLGLVMKADTDYASDDEDRKKWDGWSDEFQEATVKLGEAIRAQDKEKTGRSWFDKAAGTCTACHKVFSSNGQ